jgi:hypothetical protein
MTVATAYIPREDTPLRERTKALSVAVQKDV